MEGFYCTASRPHQEVMPAGILIFFWLNVLKHKIVEKILKKSLTSAELCTRIPNVVARTGSQQAQICKEKSSEKTLKKVKKDVDKGIQDGYNTNCSASNGAEQRTLKTT